MESEEAREHRRHPFAVFLGARSGIVGMLIAVVLVTQAGLVYVAVDQIDSTDSPTLIQPVNRSTATRPPISVDAGEARVREVPAPAASRAPEQIQADPEGPPADPEGPPAETGLDRAREQAEPRGVAPPLTGDDAPGQETRPSDPQPDPSRAPQARASSGSDTGTAASESPGGTEPEPDHPGRGPEGDGPPGQDDSDRDAGGDRGKG